MTTKNDQTGKGAGAAQDPSKTTAQDYPQGAPEAAHQGRQDYEQSADARRVQAERKRNLDHAKEAEKNGDPKPSGKGENPHESGTDQTGAEPPAKTDRDG